MSEQTATPRLDPRSIVVEFLPRPDGWLVTVHRRWGGTFVAYRRTSDEAGYIAAQLLEEAARG